MKVALIVVICLVAFSAARPGKGRGKGRGGSKSEEMSQEGGEGAGEAGDMMGFAMPTGEVEPVSEQDGQELLDHLIEFGTRVQGHIWKLQQQATSMTPENMGDVHTQVSALMEELKGEEDEAKEVVKHFGKKFMRLMVAGIEGNNDCRKAFMQLVGFAHMAEGEEKDEKFWFGVAYVANQEASCIVGGMEAFMHMLKQMKNPSGDLQKKGAEITDEELMKQGSIDFAVGASVSSVMYGMISQGYRIHAFVGILDHLLQLEEKQAPGNRGLDALRELLTQARVLNDAIESNKHLLR